MLKNKDKGKKRNLTTIMKSFDVSEDEQYGFISGIANKVGIVDYHNDITTKDTFKQTVKDNPRVKVLWNHRFDEPIGVAELSINKNGDLLADMKIYKNIETGLKAYKIAKHYQRDKVPLEMSIGSRIVEYRINEEDNTWILEQLEVYEVSLVAKAANKESLVETVKQSDAKKDDNIVAKQTRLNEIKLKLIKKGLK